MLRTIIFLFFVFSLAACNEKPSDSVKKENRSNSILSEQKEKSEKTYGEFKKNAVVMPIKDVIFYLKEEGTKLVVVQTPSLLTEEERNRIKSGVDDFMVLYNKKSPDENKWKWFPYIVTEIKFKSKEISPSNIESFYLKAYGIEAANFTDNINSYPNEESIFTKLNIKDDTLSLEYSGSSINMKDTSSWVINI